MVKQRGLFMYEQRGLEYLTEFQRTQGYLIKRDILPTLQKYYRNIQLTWDLYEYQIVAEDGDYTGITIDVTVNRVKSYKTRMGEKEGEFYLWLKGKSLILRSDHIVDNLYEYDMLVTDVFRKITQTLEVQLQRGTELNYKTRESMEQDIGVSYEQHDQFLRAIELFSRDVANYYIKPMNGQDTLEIYPYFTEEYYVYGKVANLHLYLANGLEIHMYYVDTEGKLRLMSNQVMEAERYETLLTVAHKLNREQSYTIYSRKLLEEEAKSLVKEQKKRSYRKNERGV